MKNKIFTILILTIIAKTHCYSQNWQWANSAGSVAPDNSASICLDQNGNTYIAGNVFSQNCFFKTDTLIINGLNDIFIAKYDANGTELWVKQFGGPNNSLTNIQLEGINQIVYDSTGNCIYITGVFVEQCDFGVTTLNTFTNDQQLFFGKFDLNGNCIWVKEAGGAGLDHGSKITTDFAGNLYLYASLIYSGFIDTIPVNNSGYMAKYNSNGVCLWVKKISDDYKTFSPYEPFIINSLKYFNNELYVSGRNLQDTLNIDTITIANPNYYGGYFAKFDLNGNIEWTKQIGGPNGLGTLLDIDAVGNIYLTGSFSSNYATIGNDTIHASGSREMYFAKFDNNGSKQWVTQSNSTQDVQPYNINTDGDGNTYITGYFNGNADFDTFNITAGSSSDIFLARYNTLGDCLGVRHPGEGFGGATVANASGECFITGAFKNTINFGSISMTSYGGNDIFIAKSDAITGIGGGEERKANNELKIYANPNQGKCNITVPDDFVNEKNLVLSIYDNTGKLIQQTTLEMNEGKIKVNLEAEAKGVYNVTLSSKKKSYNGKIVFE